LEEKRLDKFKNLSIIVFVGRNPQLKENKMKDKYISDVTDWMVAHDETLKELYEDFKKEFGGKNPIPYAGFVFQMYNLKKEA
jgi:hypothetical protein